MVMSEREKVFVVGGGPSLIGFGFDKLVGHDTIAVNHSLFDIPDPNYFITMDYRWLTKSGVNPERSPFNYERREYFIQTEAIKYFVFGFSPPQLEVLGEKMYRDTKYGKKYDLRLFDKVVIASEYGGIGNAMTNFHCGSDSGYSALQLAIILGYKHIYLLGMDFLSAYNTTHYKEEYRCKDLYNHQLIKLDEFLAPYANAFGHIKKYTTSNVYVCSDISRLKAYCPFVPIEEALSA